MSNKKFGLRQSLKPRANGTRQARRVIVVAYDGKVTEDDYFRGWRHLLGPSGLTIEPIYVRSGGNVFSAVFEAVKIAKSQREYDEFWCVCDIDDSTIKNIEDAIAYAAKNGIRLCMSKRSFEIWIALHYEKTSKIISCEAEAVKLVQGFHAAYSARNKVVPFSDLLSRTENACKNARWLADSGCDNPGTSVHVLVEMLHKKYIDGKK